MKVYFDNAATTPIDPEVVKVMGACMSENFGNPSSLHAHGRASKSIIEESRKKVAELVGALPGEIFFTSGGTESDNTALVSTVRSRDIKTLITSPLEHHAILHTASFLEKEYNVGVQFIRHNEKGIIDLDHAEELISSSQKALVSIMHGNNEIGNINDIGALSTLCHDHNVLLHSDTVQTLGHLDVDYHALGVDAAAGSAHKFHGPKGCGLLFVKKNLNIDPLIYGGSQERGMRAGTENVCAIAGMTKALELAVKTREENEKKLRELKTLLITRLKESIDEISFNGNSEDEKDSLAHVVSASFPETEMKDVLLFSLDLHHISVSGGSACSSGALESSHVISALNVNDDRPIVRFSLGKYNTADEVEYVVEKLASVYS